MDRDRVCRAQTNEKKRRSRSLLQGCLIGALLSVIAPWSPSCRADPTRLTAWHGDAPTRFVLPNPDGSRFALDLHRGRIVIVHFFATWCEPCRTELPALDRLAASLAAHVTVLAISVAEPGDRVRRYFAAAPVSFPVLLDHDRAVTRAWGAFTLPTSIVLDRRLKPVLRADGDVAWEDPGVRAVLQNLIKPPASPSHD